MNWSRPPKKKNIGLEGVSTVNRYMSFRASKDSHSARATARSASPLHQITRQGRQGEQKSYETAVASMGISHIYSIDTSKEEELHIKQSGQRT